MEEIICLIFTNPTLWQPEVCQMKGLDSFRHILGTPSFRNTALVVAASLTALFAWWRAREATKQNIITEQGLSFDRYQKGLELLANDQFSARHAGVLIL